MPHGTPIIRRFGAEQSIDVQRDPCPRAPIDLPARRASLIDHATEDAVRYEHARGRNAGRSGADDCDPSHAAAIPWGACQDVHSVSDDRRAGAHALSVLEPHPAILACAHQAKPGARFVAEFVPAQRVAHRQNRDQHAFARVGRHLRAIDENAHGGPSGTIARTTLPFMILIRHARMLAEHARAVQCRI